MEVIEHLHILSLVAAVGAVLPLLSFIGILLFFKRGKGAGLAIFNIAASFILAIGVFISAWNTPQIHDKVNWISVGSFDIGLGLLLNNLSVLMLLLISGIALLVHIYSLQYMKNDPNLHRYWAYLGLFCSSMMALVIVDNLFLVYMCWELVGFSSYLLIGFWFTRESAAAASKKAFIMNRIGDIGFLVGLMILLTQFHTLDIDALFSKGGLVAQSVVTNGVWTSTVGTMPGVWATVVGLALFLGATAKSAQFPLHTWLPDAMEGPTAVSSLIHAATMVAAGVFLIARVYPVFDSSVLIVIAVIGAFTAFMAATIALVQTDIKKILAFSTISQLGYMMFAMGVGAYGAGIFHLVTHAFFKCLLFLTAGSVIHELHHLKDKHNLNFDAQDIRNMGGLRKFMPLTFITMLVASLALVGIPFTSGYLSKDAILISGFDWASRHSGLLKSLPYFALLTSWLTAFYIFRLIFNVFFGSFRLESQGGSSFKLHEAPAEMAVPMAVLAVFCVFVLFSLNPLSSEASWIMAGIQETEHLASGSLHLAVPLIVNTGAVLMIFWAYRLYGAGGQAEVKIPGAGFLASQWYFDRAYRTLFVAPTLFLSKSIFWFDKQVVDGLVNAFGQAGVLLAKISSWLDRHVIDAIVNLMARIARAIGNLARNFQTGSVQHYLITMVIIVLAFFILKYFSQTL